MASSSSSTTHPNGLVTSTSSSTSRPNHTHTMGYDVFLSFRGEDTRHNFTDHLYHALVRAGLRTFRDNDDIDRGQDLKPEIETAIIQSKASIVVLSGNYANSRWCLNELWLILDQRRKCGHFVLPVFYHVNPSDVRNQRQTFNIGLLNLTKVANLTCISKCFDVEAGEGSKWTEVNVKRWKAALTEVANLTGLELTSYRSETNFITEVTETIKCNLDMKQLSTPAHLIGMEAQVEVINSWLKNEQHSVLAICGMGGSGKTTLAQHIYNLNKQDFQSSSFVQDIGKQPDWLFELQKQLLKDVMGGNKIRISNVSEGTNKIEEVLQMKKVLVVLDDIDKLEQLGVLLGTKAFPTQSKIIITTRLLEIQAWFGSISWRCSVHNISLLNDLESLELLSWHAFGSKFPMEGFKELAVQLAQYCGGNPLALKVLGSSLFISDGDPWRINTMREVWESRMNSLKSLKGDLDCGIQCVLQKSFDSLPLRTHKELFLHIACFFCGEDAHFVETILEDELYAKSGIMTLFNRCLLTISPVGKLMMHQLLQEMGRNIVSEESNDPAKRSRVWRDDESYHVLRKKDGSDTIEGLSLDMRKVEHGMRSEVLTLKTSSLANMDKLKLLQLKHVKLTGPYENFPKLRWLYWDGCPLKRMPSGLLMSSLVALDMSNGNMEKFEVPTVLNSLKYLYLKGCDKLVSIYNLYRLPKLNVLVLWNCSSLTHLCKSIGDLESLFLLDLTGCTKLWKYVSQPETVVPIEQPLISLPKSLACLNLIDCDIKFINDVCVGFCAQSSIDMLLGVNPFEQLPNNIDLKMLRILHLYSCPNLKALPCIPSTLEELYIDWCTSLERVTFQSGRFTLRGFTYECCFKLFEIQGLFKLMPIAKIDKADLGDMQWIEAYEDYKVDLVGDDITKGRIWHTQMLYEYGIMSTYLQHIKVQSMPRYEYTSSSDFLSFFVPLHHEKRRIQGLNVSCLYRSSGSNDVEGDVWVKISNISKGVIWVYNPVVYCKPIVDEDVVWLSYWPIGNILDVGDEVNVAIYVEKGTMIISECSANLVYTDVGEIEEEGNYENNTMKEVEVIGGDLSGFEVTTGGYYLCRRDVFGLKTSYWLKKFFGDNVNYTDSQGWRKTHESKMSSKLRDIQTHESEMSWKLKDSKTHHSEMSWKLRDLANAFMKIIELGVSFNSESEIGNIQKAVTSIVGVVSVTANREMGKLIVTGYVDPIEVASCLREFDNMLVEILSVKVVFNEKKENNLIRYK